jgi:DNA (cytosine-5)-methyltransferase 1
MKEKFNVVELFSGIGAQAKSLKKISKKHGIDIDFVGTCEWDIHPIIAYFLLHDGKISEIKKIKQTKEELLEELKLKNLTFDGKKPISLRFLASLSEEFIKLLYLSIQKTKNFVDITKLSASQLPNDIDLLTYSFPCQDLSNIGSLHRISKGIDRNAKNRSSLLWEVERLLSELSQSKKKLPKTLLMENVSSINAPRHKENFELWKNFLESLGYYNKVYKLYAPHFGIPQNRTRVFMLSFLTNQNKDRLENYFNKNDLEKYRGKKGRIKDFINPKDHKFLNEWLEAQPNKTPSRQVIWNQNRQLFKDGKFQESITSTLTTKQDRHPNSGNIQFSGNPKKANFRFLTPRECFLLMGFENRDYETLVNVQISTRKNYKLFNRDNLYKLTGNSIVVNMLDHVFEQIIEVDKIINK